MQNNVFNEYFAKGTFYEMVNGTKALVEVKSALVASAGAVVNGTAIGLVANKKIKVLSYAFSNIGAGAASVNVVGASTTETIVLAANEKYRVSEPTIGIVETASGVALLWNATIAGVQLYIRYIEVSV